MIDTTSLLITGLLLGLSAGLSPGPLQTLVVSETLRFKRRQGIKVAFAPLVTDPPIIIIAVYLLSRLNDIDPAIGVVAIVGSLFLAYLGFENITKGHLDVDTARAVPESFKKAVITNFLSPVPYAFWLFVAAPIAVRALDAGVAPAAVFIVSFYAVLVSCLIGISLITARSRVWLSGRGYAIAIRVLGLVLIGFGLIFLKNGLSLLHII
jgi:threonine/homoserine/homoserine lactone efflux protein